MNAPSKRETSTWPSVLIKQSSTPGRIERTAVAIARTGPQRSGR
jgi:hypothetical protein